ncbi:MAG TPA: lysylphosphatidylglycerol synthase domain-containing protein [Alphaproteobacteria bacterium]|nr:lysylphosphatidylglycerol synthase domain-containing protein [Alphaproteobacteria bacterium]
MLHPSLTEPAPLPGAETMAPPRAEPRRRLRRALFWRWVSHLVMVVALAFTAYVLYGTVRQYGLDGIAAAIAAIPVPRLGLSLLAAAGSYLCLTGFDALAVRHLGRRLPYRRIALASFASLGIGHTVGLAGLSSGVIRYRYYSRWGLSAGDVAKIVLFCGLTVGLGLLALAGLALLARPALAGAVMGLPTGAVSALGGGCLALTGLYLVLAARIRRPLRIGRWSVELPAFRIALGQVVVGALNFALVAACLHQAMAAVAEVSYAGVATAYVLANVATLITHVPGGLGVVESVVLHLVPKANVIGAVIVFRVVYFLVPFALGSATFAVSEALRRGRRAE